MDRFDRPGPSEKYLLPFEDTEIYCECGNVAKYRHKDLGDMCVLCKPEVMEEWDVDEEDLEEL